MFADWTSLSEQIGANRSGAQSQSVLAKFSGLTGREVAVVVVKPLAAILGPTAQAEPSSLVSDDEVLWCMDVICHGLSLPIVEHETIKDCVHVYCDWLSALLPQPNLTVPRPIVADANRYARKIINHFHNLFVPRAGEVWPFVYQDDLAPDIVHRQVVLCHRVLRMLHKVASESQCLVRETWDALLIFLLAINEILLAPPIVREDVADKLCERVLSVLFEVWLLACARCFPSPSLWKTLQESCAIMRHRLSLVEQWNRACLALTARLLAFSYGPQFPELKIADEDVNLIPASMDNDCVAQTWYRMLRTIGSPVALCAPQTIAKTPQFMQWAVLQANGSEPSQHPCLLALPHIFRKAIRGIAGQVDAFLGLNKTSLIGLTSSRSSSVHQPASTPNSSGPPSTSSLPAFISIGHHDTPRPPLTALRPKCNSILHLFGEWLFEAAHIGGDSWLQHTRRAQTEASRRPSSMVMDSRKGSLSLSQPASLSGDSSLSAGSATGGAAAPSAASHSATAAAGSTGPGSENAPLSSAALSIEKFEAGRAEAIGALCRIFGAKKTGEEILPVYLARFYMALQHGLKIVDPATRQCDETMASILYNSANLFRIDLDGVQVLLPAFLGALELVLPDRDLLAKAKHHLPGVTAPSAPAVAVSMQRSELRRASIHLLLSMLALPLHFQALPIRDLGTSIPDRLCTFGELKPRLINVLMNALQHETDAQNTHMLLGGLLMIVQDAAWFEQFEAGGVPTSGMEAGFHPGSPAMNDVNLLSSDSAHALFVRATYLVCHRLISTWNADLNVSLAALELLSGLARMHIKDSDALECKRAVKWICDYIFYQCQRPRQSHSKDLHSTIVAAFQCCAAWLMQHPYLLHDKDCLTTVLEVVELGISGSKSVGKPGEAPTLKDEKELKPASMRVREAAETLFTVIVEQVGYFPNECGPQSTSSLLDESTLYRHCSGAGGGDRTPMVGGQEQAVQKFRYFVTESSTIMALLEEPLGNDQDPQPTVTLLIRGPFGRHAWTMQLRHLPRSKSGTKYHAANPGRPVPMNDMPQRHEPEPRHFPDSVDRVAPCAADYSIPTLETVIARTGTDATRKLVDLIERQTVLEKLAWAETESSEDSLSHAQESQPPAVCHDFQAARLFLSHFGFLSIGGEDVGPMGSVGGGSLRDQPPVSGPDGADDSSATGDNVSIGSAGPLSAAPPLLTVLDARRSGFAGELAALDRLSARTHDTLHVFYVRNGQTRAADIVANVSESSESNEASAPTAQLDAHFWSVLHSLGDVVNVHEHAGWTGSLATSWLLRSNQPDDERPEPEDEDDHECRALDGQRSLNGERHVLYWADVGAEIAFVVPTAWNLQRTTEADAGAQAGEQGSCASLASTSSSSAADSSERSAAERSSYERSVSFVPAQLPASARVSLGSKPRTLSLELDKQRDATAATKHVQSPSLHQPADPVAPMRRRTATGKLSACVPSTKMMLVWLESYEDHANVPVDDLLAYCRTGEEPAQGVWPRAADCHIMYVHALASGLLRVRLQSPPGRMSFATPLVDGMVLSRRVAGILVRQTVYNMAKRRRLDSDHYQPPHVRRRLKVQEMVQKYSTPMTEPELLAHLFKRMD